MGTILNNISQFSSVRTVTSLNYIKKTYNIPQKNIDSFQKQISEEDKNTIVSGQQNKYSNPAWFYHFNKTMSCFYLFILIKHLNS
jgi:hypothetical protein